MDAGLENIVAAETVLSNVDGLKGRLVIAGHEVDVLAKDFSFEQVVSLLWGSVFEEVPDANVLQADLAHARLTAFQRLTPYFQDVSKRPSMEGLRLALASCPDGDSLETAKTILATLTVATANAARLRSGLGIVAPNTSLSHTDDFLFMLTGDTSTRAQSHGLAAYFNTVCDHGLNASTFAARVVASTQAGLTSAAIAGLSALKGPLHGGAPGPVLDMLDDIGAVENAENWIRAALARKERLMGFGHRVYKVRDPRADALKHAVANLPKSVGRLALAEEIEAVILGKLAIEKPDRNLKTNVEYYTAVLLEALSIHRNDFTSVFACARAAGWIAHAKEQVSTRRIIRPKSIYLGR